MILDVRATATARTHNVFSRALNGDTAYGSCAAAANTLYSVSNPGWPGLAGLRATAVAPLDGINSLSPAAGPPGGAGSPTAEWLPVQ